MATSGSKPKVPARTAYWGDTRDLTEKNRVKIGFRAKQVWKTAPAVFTKHFLKILGHPVMEDWEIPYMKRLAHIATMNGGTVLEVGFGMGISARFIQQADIKRHIIIDMNHQVADRARDFSLKAKHKVVVLEGLWEEVIDQIPDNSLDGILFDTYPLTKAEIHRNHFAFFRAAFRKLKKDGVLTYYSDEIKSFHPAHIKKLLHAGFKEANISSQVVKVIPPKDCEYWKSSTILAPIVKK